MDGTLSWIPFVVQTMTMARNVYRRRYRMGVGYKVKDDGIVTESYWEQLNEEKELLGVVCDSCLAVIRGIRRAIMCRRAVRVNSQLKSHKRFASALHTYCQLVYDARLYSTNALEGPPKMRNENLKVTANHLSAYNINILEGPLSTSLHVLNAYQNLSLY
ncbi:hypothetical protein HAX54_019733 [Datura stramonium]|uniref:Uncharacterized protein n=1 Tax=Datura stramonium TaxID=4076 RepID=A0ABS8UQZ6_DATST|nr:hypothetical protein [Datura stramonium]